MPNLARLPIFAISLLTIHDIVQGQPLVRDVTPELAERAAEYNQQQVSEDLYFAKRHRIVEISASALEPGGSITLQPFPDVEPVSLRHVSSRFGKSIATHTWIGTIDIYDDGADLTLPDSEQKKLDQLGLSAKAFFDQIAQVRLFIVHWDIELPSGEAVMSFADSAPVVSGNGGRSLERKAFVSLEGELDLRPFGGSVYRISSLRGSPRYHLLYEIDSAKDLSFVGKAADASSSEEILSERARAYDEFKLSLGARDKVRVLGEL